MFHFQRNESIKWGFIWKAIQDNVGGRASSSDAETNHRHRSVVSRHGQSMDGWTDESIAANRYCVCFSCPTTKKYIFLQQVFDRWQSFRPILRKILTPGPLLPNDMGSDSLLIHVSHVVVVLLLLLCGTHKGPNQMTDTEEVTNWNRNVVPVKRIIIIIHMRLRWSLLCRGIIIIFSIQFLHWLRGGSFRVKMLLNSFARLIESNSNSISSKLIGSIGGMHFLIGN